MYVEMRPPKSRHSEPRNNQTASLLFDRPVEEWAAAVSSGAKSWGVSRSTAWAEGSGASGESLVRASVTSANGGELPALAARRRLGVFFVGHRWLLRPSVGTHEDDEAPDHRDGVVVD